MAKETRKISSGEDYLRFIEWSNRWGYPFTATISDEEESRTQQQNRLIHRWFNDIAMQTNDSADQVKRECKFYQGCPILIAEDEQFAAFVKKLSHLTIEEKVAAMDFVSVTSAMSVKQLGRMMDAIALKYRPQGIRLTDPEMRKYEQD